MNPLSQRISIIESHLASLQRDASRLSQTVDDLKRELIIEEEEVMVPVIIPEVTVIPPQVTEQKVKPIVKEETKEKPRPPALPNQEEVAGLEMQLGRVWSVRLGILLLTTGFVFLSRYTYDSIIRDLGPGVRLTMMYLLSFVLTGAGLFFEGWRDSLKSYGRIVAAGGLAAIYYCGFAAHNIEALRVIESPALASILLTASAGLFCAVSLWKESRVMLSTSLALAFYSISVNPIGWMACISAMILGTLGIIMMVRYRWVEVGFVVLIGSYLSYVWLQLSVAQGNGLISHWFLIAYWILFTVASLIMRRDISADRHALFSSINNTAFFFLFSFVLKTGQRIENHALFCLIFGGILITLGLAAKSRFPEKSRFIHLAKGLGIFTLGLALILNGHHLFIALLIEALVLMALNLRKPHRFIKIASWIMGLLSCLSLTQVPLSEIPPLAFLLGTLGWLALGTLHRRIDCLVNDAEHHPGGFTAAVIGVVFLIFGFMSSWSVQDRILTLGLLGAIATFLVLLPKLRVLFSDSLVVFHAAAFIGFVTLFTLPGITMPTLLAASALTLLMSGPLVPLFHRAATPDAAAPFHLLSGFLLTISLSFVVLSLDQSPLSDTSQFALILLISLAGTVVARFTGLLAHSLVPFAMHLAIFWLALDLLDGPLLMIGIIITLTHLAFVTKHHKLSDQLLLQTLLTIIATSFWGLWLVHVIPYPAIPLTLTGVGFLLATRVIQPKLASVLSVPFFVLGFSSAFYSQNTGELYLCLIAPLSLHLYHSKLGGPARFQVLAIASLLLLWTQLTLDAPPLPLAAVWAITGTVLLLIGLGLKSRCFRLLALIILVSSLGHLMIIDLVKLDPLPRILSFMTLGLGLLGLGFVYNRYQDRLKHIL